MEIILKEITTDDGVRIVPICAVDSRSFFNLSKSILLESLTNMMTDEQKKITTVKSLYVNRDIIKRPSAQPGMTNINFILKLVNGHASKILKVSDNKYELNDISELLNAEITNASIEYKVFSVGGKLLYD